MVRAAPSTRLFEATVRGCHPVTSPTSGPHWRLTSDACPRPASRRSAGRPRIGALASAGSVGGCRVKPFEKTRSTLAEAHLTTVVHDVLATNRLNATDEMAVFGTHLFGTHPYKRSSVLAWGFPDSVVKRSPDPGRARATHRACDRGRIRRAPALTGCAARRATGQRSSHAGVARAHRRRPWA
jgi:hypothetical protein